MKFPLLLLGFLTALLIIPALGGGILGSPDGIVTLASPDPIAGEIGVAYPVTPPEGWVPIGDAYLVTLPEGSSSLSLVLTFRVPSEVVSDPDTVVFLAYGAENGWDMLPSRLKESGSGPVVSAPIAGSGVYSLMMEDAGEAEIVPTPTEAALIPVLPFAAVLFASLIFLLRKP